MEGPPAPPRGSLAGLWVPALLIALGLLQLLPHLTEVDFHREEGRRVLPAREMLANGNWVLPTLWGQPYLSKPPGIFWLQGTAQALAGGVFTWSARLVSVAATLGTLLALWACGRRWFGPRAGTLAALSFLVAPEVLAKGRLAEIEAPLALFVFLAVACWWLAQSGRGLWCVPAGLALAAALLLKGPAALVFFLGPPLLLALGRREPRLLLSGRLFAVLAIGAGLAGLWVLALFDQVGAEMASTAWGSQVTGQGGRSPAQYLDERLKFLLGVLLGSAPASLCLLLGGGTRRGRQLLRQGEAQLAGATIAAGFVFFLLFPGTSVRYFYPGLPFVALLSGALVDRALEAGESRLQRLLSGLALGLAAVGALLVIALCIGSLRPLGDIEVDATGLLLAALMAAAVGATLRASGARRIVWAVFGVPLLVSHILTSQVEVAKAARHARAPIAAELDARLGPGEVLWVPFWDNFNTLLYLEHEVRWAADWHELSVGDAWLLTGAQWRELEAQPTQAVHAQEPWHFEVRGASRVLVRLELRGP